ncbi:MAG: hypothetical protein WKF40_03870 [Thermoleophilaceae bacterium]
MTHLDESEPNGGLDGPNFAFFSNSNLSEASNAASKLPMSEASPPLLRAGEAGHGEDAGEHEQAEQRRRGVASDVNGWGEAAFRRLPEEPVSLTMVPSRWVGLGRRPAVP